MKTLLIFALALAAIPAQAAILHPCGAACTPFQPTGSAGEQHLSDILDGYYGPGQWYQGVDPGLFDEPLPIGPMIASYSDATHALSWVETPGGWALKLEATGSPVVGTVYSHAPLNPGGVIHALAFGPTADLSMPILFAWEDWIAPGSDRDFNDFVHPVDMTPIPEPGFYGVLALGLSGLWLARRRRDR